MLSYSYAFVESKRTRERGFSLPNRCKSLEKHKLCLLNYVQTTGGFLSCRVVFKSRETGFRVKIEELASKSSKQAKRRRQQVIKQKQAKTTATTLTQINNSQTHAHTHTHQQKMAHKCKPCSINLHPYIISFSNLIIHINIIISE